MKAPPKDNSGPDGDNIPEDEFSLKCLPDGEEYSLKCLGEGQSPTGSSASEFSLKCIPDGDEFTLKCPRPAPRPSTSSEYSLKRYRVLNS